MTIGVKVLERPIEDVSYIRATVKGMALTFKHLFQDKVTVQYPEQKWPLSPRWRGTRRAASRHAGRATTIIQAHQCNTRGICPFYKLQ